MNDRQTDKQTDREHRKQVTPDTIDSDGMDHFGSDDKTQKKTDNVE